MERLSRLKKVNDSLTVNRYDNGWMVEVGGRDVDNEWKIAKILCTTEDEMTGVLKEWNTKEIDN